jgi:hypothetical protein
MRPDAAVPSRSLLAAAFIAAVLAALAIGVVSRFDPDRMTYGDGLIYRNVAQHLAAPPAEADRLFADVGTDLRYGRIGLPVLLYAGSAGRASAMPYVQPILMVIAAGAAAAAVRRLFPTMGLYAALLPFAGLGLTASMLGGYQEPIAVALGLWAVVSAREERWVRAAVLLACAMLVRENAAVVMVGLILWNVASVKRKGAAILAASIVPVAAWHAAVWSRFGTLPLFDPHLRANHELGPPFVALWRSLHIRDPHVVAAIVVHGLLAAIALMIARRSDLGAIAAVSAFFVIWNGPPQWFNVGDGVRLQVFLQIFTILGVAATLPTMRHTRPRVIELDPPALEHIEPALEPAV